MIAEAKVGVAVGFVGRFGRRGESWNDSNELPL